MVYRLSKLRKDLEQGGSSSAAFLQLDPDDTGNANSADTQTVTPRVTLDPKALDDFYTKMMATFEENELSVSCQDGDKVECIQNIFQEKMDQLTHQYFQSENDGAQRNYALAPEVHTTVQASTSSEDETDEERKKKLELVETRMGMEDANSALSKDQYLTKFNSYAFRLALQKKWQEKVTEGQTEFSQWLKNDKRNSSCEYAWINNLPDARTVNDGWCDYKAHPKDSPLNEWRVEDSFDPEGSAIPRPCSTNGLYNVFNSYRKYAETFTFSARRFVNKYLGVCHSTCESPDNRYDDTGRLCDAR